MGLLIPTGGGDGDGDDDSDPLSFQVDIYHKDAGK